MNSEYKKRRHVSELFTVEPCAKCSVHESSCMHRHAPSFSNGKVRACPICGCKCIEQGASYKGYCRSCEHQASLRSLWVEVDREGAVMTTDERREA